MRTKYPRSRCNQSLQSGHAPACAYERLETRDLLTYTPQVLLDAAPATADLLMGRSMLGKDRLFVQATTGGPIRWAVVNGNENETLTFAPGVMDSLHEFVFDSGQEFIFFGAQTSASYFDPQVVVSDGTLAHTFSTRPPNVLGSSPARFLGRTGKFGMFAYSVSESTEQIFRFDFQTYEWTFFMSTRRDATSRLVDINENLVLIQNGDDGARKVLVTDGTAQGTTTLTPASMPYLYDRNFLRVIADSLIFINSDVSSRPPDVDFYAVSIVDGSVTKLPAKSQRAHWYESITVEGRTYYQNFDEAHGEELWVTETGRLQDGHLLLDVTPGVEDSRISSMLWHDGFLYFVTQSGFIWRTNGEPGYLQRVGNVVALGVSGDVTKLTEFSYGIAGNTVIFGQQTNGAGFELWSSNVAEQHSKIFLDILPGSRSSKAFGFITTGDKVFFMANDGVHGREIWVSNGEVAGTHLAADLNSYSASSVISNLTETRTHLYFRSQHSTPSATARIWSTDGSPGGVQLVGEDDYFKSAIIASAGDWALIATSVLSDNGIHRLNRSNGGRMEPFLPSLEIGSQLVSLGDRVIFAANDGIHGWEPWISDGTVEGTRMIIDLNSLFGQFTRVGDQVLFTAGPSNDLQALWITDGTEAGTKQLSTETQGNITRIYSTESHVFVADSAHPKPTWWYRSFTHDDNWTVVPGDLDLYLAKALFTIEDAIYFLVSDILSARLIMLRRDGLTTIKELASHAIPIGRFSSGAIFAVSTGSNDKQWWFSDGTEQGTKALSNVDVWKGTIPLVFENRVFYLENGSLYSTDETTQNTIRISDIRGLGGFQLDIVPQLTRFKGDFYFVAFTPKTGYEVYKVARNPADTNYDGRVDLLDFAELRSSFQKKGTDLSADLNFDGRVDLLDFSILRSNFGFTSAAPPAPQMQEPEQVETIPLAAIALAFDLLDDHDSEPFFPN